MVFYFKKTKKGIIMTGEDININNNIITLLIFVDFCEKNIESDKVKDHCHLTGN